jgi:adenylosuccinate lyase
MRIRLIAQKFSQINSSDLLAIGPLDGRYKSQIGELSDYFSEYALIKYRVKVELKWL